MKQKKMKTGKFRKTFKNEKIFRILTHLLQEPLIGPLKRNIQIKAMDSFKFGDFSRIHPNQLLFFCSLP